MEKREQSRIHALHSSKNAVKHGYNEYGKNEFANRGVCLIKLLHVTRTKYVK